jgi:hypothetical protein
MQETIGTTRAKSSSFDADQFKEWIRGFSFPISIPQLHRRDDVDVRVSRLQPDGSADGSLTDVYAKSFQLAEQTYEQSAAAWNGKPAPDSSQTQER